MALSDCKFASGHRVLAGTTGEVYRLKGAIYLAKAPIHGMDSHLFEALKIGVDVLRVKILIASVDTGEHAEHSRHYWGGAGDIDDLSPTEAPGWHAATLQNPLAVQFVSFYRQHGWRYNEGGNWPGVLLGPPDSAMNGTKKPHRRHIHLSIARRTVPGAALEEPEPNDDCEADGD